MTVCLGLSSAQLMKPLCNRACRNHTCVPYLVRASGRQGVDSGLEAPLSVLIKWTCAAGCAAAGGDGARPQPGPGTAGQGDAAAEQPAGL